MAAATGDAAAVKPDDFVVDLGFDIDDFDVQDFDFEDFDLAADEFCDAYSAFVANADNANNKIVGGGGKAAGGGWLAGLCGDDGGEGSGSREGSPDSDVTDGPLAGDEEAMLAYVAELERFMMEDDGDVEEDVFCRDGDGEERVEELISADRFFGDLQLATDSNRGVVTATPGALRNENGGEEENDDGDVLAAREDEQASRKRARQSRAQP